MEFSKDIIRYKKYLINKPGVYSIINTVTGDMYIGSSINLYKRLCDHMYVSFKKKHCNRIFSNAFNKYGYENFKVKILKFCISNDKYCLMNNEQYYIERLNPKYNIQKEAYRNSSYRHTDEAKEKIRLSGIGRVTNNKRCIQLDKDFNLIDVYDSCTSAHLKTGINLANIIEVCHYWENGFNILNRKTAGGFIWKFTKLKRK